MKREETIIQELGVQAISDEFSIRRSDAVALMEKFAMHIRDAKELASWVMASGDTLKLGYTPKGALPGSFKTAVVELLNFPNELHAVLELARMVYSDLKMPVRWEIVRREFSRREMSLARYHLRVKGEKYVIATAILQRKETNDGVSA